MQSILLRKCEEAKIFLSEIDSVDIFLEDENDDDVDELLFTLNNDDFNSINNELFEKSTIPIQKVMSKAEITENEIDCLFLVGCSTYMKKIRELLKKTVSKDPSPQTSPSDAVAIGACITSAWLYYKKMKGQCEMTLNFNFSPSFNSVIEILLEKRKKIEQEKSSEIDSIYSMEKNLEDKPNKKLYIQYDLSNSELKEKLINKKLTNTIKNDEIPKINDETKNKNDSLNQNSDKLEANNHFISKKKQKSNEQNNIMKQKNSIKSKENNIIDQPKNIFLYEISSSDSDDSDINIEENIHKRANKNNINNQTNNYESNTRKSPTSREFFSSESDKTNDYLKKFISKKPDEINSIYINEKNLEDKTNKKLHIQNDLSNYDLKENLIDMKLTNKIKNNEIPEINDETKNKNDSLNQNSNKLEANNHFISKKKQKSNEQNNIMKQKNSIKSKENNIIDQPKNIFLYEISSSDSDDSDINIEENIHKRANKNNINNQTNNYKTVGTKSKTNVYQHNPSNIEVKTPYSNIASCQKNESETTRNNYYKSKQFERDITNDLNANQRQKISTTFKNSKNKSNQKETNDYHLKCSNKQSKFNSTNNSTDEEYKYGTNAKYFNKPAQFAHDTSDKLDKYDAIYKQNLLNNIDQTTYSTNKRNKSETKQYSNSNFNLKEPKFKRSRFTDESPNITNDFNTNQRQKISTTFKNSKNKQNQKETNDYHPKYSNKQSKFYYADDSSPKTDTKAKFNQNNEKFCQHKISYLSNESETEPISSNKPSIYSGNKQYFNRTNNSSSEKYKTKTISLYPKNYLSEHLNATNSSDEIETDFCIKRNIPIYNHVEINNKETKPPKSLNSHDEYTNFSLNNMISQYNQSNLDDETNKDTKKKFSIYPNYYYH